MLYVIFRLKLYFTTVPEMKLNLEIIMCTIINRTIIVWKVQLCRNWKSFTGEKSYHVKLRRVRTALGIGELDNWQQISQRIFEEKNKNTLFSKRRNLPKGVIFKLPFGFSQPKLFVPRCRKHKRLKEGVYMSSCIDRSCSNSFSVNFIAFKKNVKSLIGNNYT